MGRRTDQGHEQSPGGPGLAQPRLQAFQQGQRRQARRKAHPWPGLGDAALGSQVQAARHHAGKRRGIQNVGPTADRGRRQRQAGPGQEGQDLRQLHSPAARARLHRRLPRNARLRPRHAHHSQALLSGGAARRHRHQVARADPRRTRQHWRARWQAAAVPHGGRVHRLQLAVPVDLRARPAAGASDAAPDRQGHHALRG